MNQAKSINNQKSFPFLRKLNQGDMIICQGSEFRGYFLIKTGLVKTHRIHESGGKSILSIKIQGEFLGEFTARENRRLHTYSASALEDNTVVEFIPYEDDTNLRLIKILETMQAEILNARNRLERVLFQDAENRIRQTLKELGKKLGKKFGQETLVKISLTHEDLAAMSDTSRQTVSMVLSGLKSQNKINYSRGRILFRNLDSL
ncbi:Crp/Fnr family transcriptional regulator [Algoriphagus litoralis]|uniref:Crp/Fnr family transcriptional regulator n=1 Tax=Algoriphagus litoralis TaxID=2202829 RepID=UPI000DBAB3DF|nr:Crp/Fnr family transcriptional regulator [Algoriphagus litoralis]